jgi:hypothetical protein
MRLSGAMPSVCSAIGGTKFQELAGVALARRTGPANGSNVYFEFDLSSSGGEQVYALQEVTKPSAPTAQATERVPGRCSPPVDFRDALVLVSCVSGKQTRSSPARLLYTSPWFSLARRLVERSGARWFILSAKYGLVSPDAEIAPYEETLNTAGVAKRKIWAEKVLKKLVPELGDTNRVVILAGGGYREFLVEPLHRLGFKVEIPMSSLRIGEQLAWLSQHQ